MRTRIWGSRGTVATPGNDTVRYGGNTSCVEVRLENDSVLILDGGTGLRALGAQLAAEPPARIDLLITHLHVDHVEGLGVFEPIWHPETELHIWGPPSPVTSLSERLAWYFSPPLFPVHLSEVPARTEFHDTPDGEWSVDGATRLLDADPPPRPDRRLPDRGRRQDARVPHRPRAGVRRRRARSRSRPSGSAATPSPPARTSCSTTASTRRTSTRGASGSATRA